MVVGFECGYVVVDGCYFVCCFYFEVVGQWLWIQVCVEIYVDVVEFNGVLLDVDFVCFWYVDFDIDLFYYVWVVWLVVLDCFWYCFVFWLEVQGELVV